MRWVASPTGARLVVDPTSAGLRRELGAVAWSALEVLALAAELTSDGRLVATLNAREVASALGVGRDAAGNALALLRRRELVVLEQSRRAGGHFTSTRYVLRIDVVSESTHPQPRRNRQGHASTPTLFDTPTTDTDHGDAHGTSAKWDSRIAATKLPEISHTLAFSNAPAVEPDGATC